MNDRELEREIRDTFRRRGADVLDPEAVPPAREALRLTRRRQLTNVVTMAVVALALVGASVAGASALFRASDRRVPAEPPETLSPEGFEAASVGSYPFGGLTVDADGVVWGTGPGLTSYDPASGSLRAYTLADDPALADLSMEAPAVGGGVWISSWMPSDGVMRRFDGASIAETLAPGSIHQMAQGPDGTVWGTGAEGLFRWNGSAWVSVPSEGLALDGAIAVDADGNVWVANVRYPGPHFLGVSRYDGTGWATWTTNQGLPSDSVYAIAPGANGEVWIGTADGAASFLEGSWTAYPSETSGVEHVISLAVTDEGVVVAGRGREGAARFDGSAWRPLSAEGGFAADATPGAPIQVAAGPSGLWATTSVGLFRFDGTGWELTVPAGPGPSADTLRASSTSVAAADADTLWIASGADGVWRVQGDAWTHFDARDGLPGDRANDIAIAGDGTVWAATDAGLARFDGTRWEPVGSSENVTEHLAIAFAPDGTAWTAVGFRTADTTGWTVQSVDGTVLREIGDGVRLDEGPVSLAVRAGNDVWIGARGSYTGGGLAHFDGTGWTLIDRPTISPEYPTDPNCSGFSSCDDIPVREIVTTPDGSVWVAFGLWAGSDDPTLAVARFDGTGWQAYYRDAEGVPFTQAAYGTGDLAVTPSGRLLFATGGGLLEFRDDAWHLVRSGDFSHLAVSPDGTAWLNGDGLFRMPAP